MSLLLWYNSTVNVTCFQCQKWPLTLQVLFLCMYGTHIWGSFCLHMHYNLIHWGRDKMATISDDLFECIFMNENVCILIKISMEFVSRGPINDIPALFQMMTWHWPSDKPLSEPMMINLLTHICVTHPQWINAVKVNSSTILSTKFGILYLYQSFGLTFLTR